jgi:hypothetical protein
MILRLLQRSRIAHVSCICLTVFALAVMARAAHAKPLDKEACDTLQAEKLSLVVLGIDKEMAKGPDWAKANLAPARLDMVKRLLTVNEQMKFRCPSVIAMAQANAKATAASVVSMRKSALGKQPTTPAAPHANPATMGADAETPGGVTVRAKTASGAKAVQQPKTAPARMQ